MTGFILFIIILLIYLYGFSIRYVDCYEAIAKTECGNRSMKILYGYKEGKEFMCCNNITYGYIKSPRQIEQFYQDCDYYKFLQEDNDKCSKTLFRRKI